MNRLSRFLPDSFDPQAPVVLVAGRGDYPVLSARRIRSAGVPLRLVALRGETADSLRAGFPASEQDEVRVGQIKRLLKAIGAFGGRHVVLAGQIQPGRLFGGIHPDLRAAKILASLKERNAATIFGAVVREIESAGHEVLDARAFLDEDLAAEGAMTSAPPKADTRHLAHGIQIARECARLHIGQGVLVRKGTVLAVEAFEGTDAMLRRGGGFKTDGKIFVKTPHPDHDYRFDVPVFGPRTLATMREAGIGTAALAADRTVILDKEEVLREARKRGIEILGF